MKRILGAALCAALVLSGAVQLVAAPFSAGNLAVLRTDETDNNSPASIVELAPGVANQVPTNVIAIPGAGATGLRFSGSATSTGYLSHTNDRSLLTFNGANAADTSANANTLNPRAVGTLDGNGTYALQTTYTGTSGNQTRSSSSLNNTTWFIGDQGGFYSNGTVAASPSGNIRSVKAFGGSVYSFAASATAPPVSTISAPVAGTVTALPGLPNGTSAMQDFYMIQSGSSGATYDVLYVLSTTNATTGLVEKYSLVGGSWTANGSYATSFGGFGLAAQPLLRVTGANLYVTSGTGATIAGTVVQLNDTAGFNSAINIVTANNISLYTAPTGTILKGVDFVPTAVPEPATLATAGTLLAAFGLSPRRRRIVI